MRTCECGSRLWGGQRKWCAKCALLKKAERNHRHRAIGPVRKKTYEDQDPEDAMTDEEIEAAVQARFDAAKAAIAAMRRAA